MESKVYSESAAELNQASAMKARAEAWQTANYAGPEAKARTSSARSVVDLNERRGHEINAAIRFIDEQIKTEGTKRVLHMSDAALNDAKQALVDLEAITNFRGHSVKRFLSSTNNIHRTMEIKGFPVTI